MAHADTEMLTCGGAALDHLRARDPRLGAFIDRIGPLSREVITDPFRALVHTVCGQQISSAVHARIWARVKERVRPLPPEGVLALPDAALRECGLSGAKTACVRAVSAACADGALDLDGLAALDDDAVRARLLAVKGIGPWSVEMMLIFCLRRPDVLSFGDFGIRRGLRLLHGLKDLDRAYFEKVRARYSPHGTTASLYLWELASGRYPEWPDPALAAAD